MKEVKEILDRISVFEPNEKAILATVVDVQGSGYRLPGARMLILENGETYGMISGGCLESDVLERAKKVLQTGRSEVFVYDTTREENSVFSLNMGCRGVIRILLESVGRDSPLLSSLQNVRVKRNRLTAATLISSDTEPKAEPGARLFYSDGLFTFDKLPSFLAEAGALRDECSDFHHKDSEYRLWDLTTAEGRFEFAVESILPPVNVLLFGAGADAVPLARIVSDLGWQLSVFDHRPAFLTCDRFPAADRLVLTERGKRIELPAAADSRTFAVVMTHNYERDVVTLPDLLRSDVAYVAALGPKRRTEQILQELSVAGESFTGKQLAKLYAPAGLDIGADTPEAIALSITSEIQSVLKSRDGGHLRNRMGSIYDRK